MSLLTFSSPDSRRFGLRVFRGSVSVDDAERLRAEVLGGGCDVAIVRSPVGDGAMAAALSRVGFPAYHCDTLVVYRCDLPNRPRQESDASGLVIRLASFDDAAALEALVGEAFVGYQSHYSGNPLLSPLLVLNGYKEWASSLLAHPQGRCWLAFVGEKLVGFIASIEEPHCGVGRIILNGVSPAHTGQGIYGALVECACADFMGRGLRSVEVSTQVWNRVVQKVWLRAGFRMVDALDTFHLNPLLSSGAVVYERSFETLAPPRAGGEAEASPGPERASILAAMYGSLEVAVGSRSRALRSCTCIQLRPVSDGRSCAITVRTEFGSTVEGARTFVAQVSDGRGPLVIGYATTEGAM